METPPFGMIPRAWLGSLHLLSRSEIVVGITISMFTNGRTRICHAKVSTISKYAQISPRHTTRCLNSLQTGGFIAINRRRGKSSEFYITSPKTNPP